MNEVHFRILLFRFRNHKRKLPIFPFDLAETLRFVGLYQSNKDTDRKIVAG